MGHLARVLESFASGGNFVWQAEAGLALAIFRRRYATLLRTSARPLARSLAVPPVAPTNQAASQPANRPASVPNVRLFPLPSLGQLGRMFRSFRAAKVDGGRAVRNPLGRARKICSSGAKSVQTSKMELEAEGPRGAEERRGEERRKGSGGKGDFRLPCACGVSESGPRRRLPGWPVRAQTLIHLCERVLH
mgnify:CR=1 FL=1